MTVKELYKEIQGSYEEVIDRLGSDDIVEMFLQKFLNDKSYSELLAAAEVGDIDGAFAAAHTLKGLTGNMAFLKLYLVTVDLVEQLRPKTDPINMELLERVKAEYENTVRAIQNM